MLVIWSEPQLGLDKGIYFCNYDHFYLPKNLAFCGDILGNHTDSVRTTRCPAPWEKWIDVAQNTFLWFRDGMQKRLKLLDNFAVCFRLLVGLLKK